MKIIDLYIIKKYLGTFGFMLGLLTIIVLVIDVQAKAKDRIQRLYRNRVSDRFLSILDSESCHYVHVDFGFYLRYFLHF